jgi:hypothetical protein
MVVCSTYRISLHILYLKETNKHKHRTF